MSKKQTPNSDAEQRHNARPDEADAQEALRDSELRCRSLFESAQEGILILDADTGMIVDVNPYLVNLLGHSRELFLTRKFWELGFLGDALANEDKFSELRAKGYVRYDDLPLETSDGRHIAVEFVSNVHLLNRQRVIRCNIHDITERKEMEAELKEKQERLELAMDAGDHGFWDWNLETDDIYFSPRYYTMLGYEPGELPMVLDTWVKLMHPEDRKTIVPKVQEYVANTDPYEVEFRLKCKNGSYKWIMSKGKAYLNDDSGKPNRAVGVHVDINERIIVEENLRIQKERLNNILEGTNVGTWEWNVQTGETIFNEKWANIIGYTLKEISPVSIDTWMKFAHPDDLKKSEELLEKHFNGELDYYHFESRMKHKDGSWIWVLDRGKVITRDDDGKPLRVFGTHQDITKRKQVEEALKDSEHNFRTFFETMDDIIIIGNIQGEIFYTNPAATEKLCYSTDELKGMHILDLHPETKRKEAEQIFADMFAGKRDSCPLPLASKDGSFVPVETRVWFGKWDGKDCVFGISKDLSAQQEALQKFNKMFDSNPALMAVSKLPDRKFTEVNAAFLQTLGYDNEEIIGNTADDLNLFVEPERQNQAGDALQKNGKIHNMEFNVKAKNGSIITGLFSGEIIECQGKQYFLTVMTDITVLKKVQEELKVQTALQEILVEISSDFINLPLEQSDTAVHNALATLGQFVDLDRVYVFSYDFEKQTTTNTYEWCNDGTSPQIEELQDVPLEAVPDWVEHHKKGESMLIPNVSELSHQSGLREILEPQGIKSLLAIPMMNGDQCLGFVGFDAVRNIHVFTKNEHKLLQVFSLMLVNLYRRSKAENELIEANKSLEEETAIANALAEKAQSANNAKSEFLASLSHEIRTPMNAVLGFAQVLKRDSSLTPKQSQHVSAISRSGNHLLGLINDILDISKIEAGKIEFSPSVLSLRDLLDDLEMMFRTRTEDKHLQLIVDRDEGLPSHVLADEENMRKVLVNLLGNAVKFTLLGGVSLRVRSKPVRGRPEGEEKSLRLEFEVEDSGPGISQSDQDRIFDKFSQGEAGARTGGGTGLGLFLSRQLAEMMGGGITCESEPGKGSCFRFDLLCEPAEAEQKEPRESRRVTGLASGTNPGRILVVDDNVANRDLLHALLLPLGFEIRDAENGRKAVEVFEEWSPHAVLMDIRMPVMDGYEATRRIKATQAGRSTPVIALTASALLDSEKEILATGASAYISKPFREEEFYEVLGKYLGLGFVYEEESAGVQKHPKAKDLAPEDLAALPRGLIQAMLEAQAEGDITRLLELIRQVEPLDRDAAWGLKALADRYDYPTLEKLLDNGGNDNE